MTDNNGYIVAAYVITWLTLLGYAVRLHLVSRRARAQVEWASQGGGRSDRE